MSEAVNLGIEGAFQLQHVRVLLRVDMIVGEDNGEAINVKPNQRGEG